MSREAAEQSLRALITRDLDRMLLSVPKISDEQEWAVVKSRFDLMIERLDYFASTSEDADNRLIFQNAAVKLKTITPKAFPCRA